MDLHDNARTTPFSRALMVDRVTRERQPVRAVAADFGVSPTTVRKWCARAAAEGAAGLADRSARPHRSPRATAAAVVARMLDLRRQRWTCARIARTLGVATATAARHLKRHGLSRLQALDPSEPARRYQRQAPGELVHLDVKKLGRIERIGHRITGDRRHSTRGAGWEFVHVAIDDASRLAYIEILPDERKASAIAFLERALAWFRGFGIEVARIMTDNGSAYRAREFAAACRRRGIRHLFTRPYTPRTNGKAERFIQTALREWSYAVPYVTSAARTAALPPWLHRYNWHRPHTSLGGKPPITRLRLSDNNLMRLHN
jgi:transposase InsO family protein